MKIQELVKNNFKITKIDPGSECVSVDVTMLSYQAPDDSMADYPEPAGFTAKFFYTRKDDNGNEVLSDSFLEFMSTIGTNKDNFVQFVKDPRNWDGGIYQGYPSQKMSKGGRQYYSLSFQRPKNGPASKTELSALENKLRSLGGGATIIQTAPVQLPKTAPAQEDLFNTAKRDFLRRWAKFYGKENLEPKAINAEFLEWRKIVFPDMPDSEKLTKQEQLDALAAQLDRDEKAAQERGI